MLFLISRGPFVLLRLRSVVRESSGALEQSTQAPKFLSFDVTHALWISCGENRPLLAAWPVLPLLKMPNLGIVMSSGAGIRFRRVLAEEKQRKVGLRNHSDTYIHRDTKTLMFLS